MNHFDYIEHVINEPASSRIKLRFSANLINDPELRYEYHLYIKLAEFVEEQEKIIKGIIKDLTDFSFSVEIANSIPDIENDLYEICKTNEDSGIIRSVIEANRPPKPGENRGWFKAAALLSIALPLITSFIAISKDILECFRPLINAL
jgi:hypothetical protein